MTLLSFSKLNTIINTEKFSEKELRLLSRHTEEELSTISKALDILDKNIDWALIAEAWNH